VCAESQVHSTVRVIAYSLSRGHRNSVHCPSFGIGTRVCLVAVCFEEFYKAPPSTPSAAHPPLLGQEGICFLLPAFSRRGGTHLGIDTPAGAPSAHGGRWQSTQSSIFLTTTSRSTSHFGRLRGTPAVRSASRARRASMMTGRLVSIQSANDSTRFPTCRPSGVSVYSTWGGTVAYDSR